MSDAASLGIVDNGTILANGGTLTLANTVSGSGDVVIAQNSTVKIDNVLGEASIVFRAGVGKTLLVESGGSVTGTISGFGGGDTIDEKQDITSVTYAGGALTLLDGTNTVGTLFLAGNFNSNDFHVTPDGAGGTNITYGAGEIALARILQSEPQYVRMSYHACGQFHLYQAALR